MFKEIAASAFERRMGFPIGRERRRSRRIEAHSRSAELTQVEASGGKWPVFDSPLKSFGSSFNGILKGLSLETYVRQYFENKSIVGVELGGPGIKLFNQLNQAKGVVIKRSIGVTLNKPVDARMSSIHEIVTGDLNTEKVYIELTERLDGDRADLIISRMVGGLDFLGKDPIFFAQQMAYLYENALSKNGAMLIELPPFMENLILDWMELANASGLRVVYDPIKSALLVERNNNSPKKFPLLPASSMRDIYRKTKPMAFLTRLRRIFYKLAKNEIVDKFIER